LDFLHHPLLILKPEGIRFLIGAYGLVAVAVMIFLESGVFPVLPGDSLLVVCGIYAATPAAQGGGVLSLAALMTVLPLCAIVGSQIGFGAGRWAGLGAYQWRDRNLGFVPLYRRKWLKRTEDFYTRWGGFAVVVGRWVPFVRTGAPLLAGVTRMSYGKYVPYNILGALSWIWSMVLVGYFLPPIVAGVAPNFRLEEHIDMIVLVVVALSLIPVAYTFYKESAGGGKSPAAPAAKAKPVSKRGRPKRRR
jgi:membrane-associated protein